MSHCCFFFNDTATTEIYTLSLHDALPIWRLPHRHRRGSEAAPRVRGEHRLWIDVATVRSEEHTSELQSHSDLVCRLLLEKKKINLLRKNFASEHLRHVILN